MNENPLDKFLKSHSERADEYRDIIEEMLGDHDSYGYAESTLLGILDYIDKNDTVSDGQVRAIENIRDAPSRGYRNGRR